MYDVVPTLAMADELFAVLDGLTHEDVVNREPVQLPATESGRSAPVRTRLVAPDGSAVTAPDGEPLWIGRRPSVDVGEWSVRIDHPLVSRRHLVVTGSGGVHVATDLGSRNGSFVHRAGQEIVVGEGCALQAGDRLTTGDGTLLLEVRSAG